MTLFGTRQFARGNRWAAVTMVLLSMVVTVLFVLFVAWEMASELAFTSTVTTPIYPEQVADSATSPVTTTGR